MTASPEPTEADQDVDPLCHLFSIADKPADSTKTDIVRLAVQCSARDLNSLIVDLEREREWHRRRNYELATLIGTVTDELRRRAERFERNP